MNPQPTFDKLPDMVHEIRQNVIELKEQWHKYLDSILTSSGQKSPDEIRIYGDKALAKYLNCTIQTVSRLKMAGKVPFHRYGRKYYYLGSEIDQAFKGRTK